MVPYSQAIVPLLLTAGIALLIAAALHDLAARTIPDPLPAAIACIGVLLRLHDGSLEGALIAAGIVFLVTFLAWRAGGMGGGDVKLLTAVALFLPPDRLPASATAIALAGAMLALPYLALRGPRRAVLVPPPRSLVARAWRAERFRLRRGGPLPYGVAIAIGTVLALPGAGA